MKKIICSILVIALVFSMPWYNVNAGENLGTYGADGKTILSASGSFQDASEHYFLFTTDSTTTNYILHIVNQSKGVAGFRAAVSLTNDCDTDLFGETLTTTSDSVDIPITLKPNTEYCFHLYEPTSSNAKFYLELSDPTKTKVVDSITLKLNSSSQIMKKGATFQLKATVKTTNSEKGVTYSSSKKSVATVSSKGVITAKQAGTATITCTSKADSSVKKRCKVTVVTDATGITLSKKTVTLTAGTTKKLSAKLTPVSAQGQKIIWSSSNKKVATISNGTITALSAGTTTIKATVTYRSSKKVVASCKVTVKKAPTPDYQSYLTPILKQVELTSRVSDMYNNQNLKPTSSTEGWSCSYSNAGSLSLLRTTDKNYYTYFSFGKPSLILTNSEKVDNSKLIDYDFECDANGLIAVYLSNTFLDNDLDTIRKMIHNDEFSQSDLDLLKNSSSISSYAQTLVIYQKTKAGKLIGKYFLQSFNMYGCINLGQSMYIFDPDSTATYGTKVNVNIIDDTVVWN